MKKFYKYFVIASTLFVPLNLAGQSSDIWDGLWGLGVGPVLYNSSGKSNLGIQVGFIVSNFYFDVSAGGDKGKGQYLDFSSSYTRATDKVSVTSINVGRAFSVSSFTLIPKIGVAIEEDIYEDTLAFYTWFNGESRLQPNLGLNISFAATDNSNIYIGVGTYEKVSMGLSFYYKGTTPH
jgi:hypothetical protein